MNKTAITAALQEKHQSLISFIDALSEEEFMQSANAAWTAGQQLSHIHLSLTPLLQGLRLPAFVLMLVFGKANRPSKSYEALIEKYKEKLRNGGRATLRFTPLSVSVKEKQELIKKVKSSVKKLSGIIARFDEDKLDRVILPHPLLGKVTLREMMYFTIYHAEHHEWITRKNLGLLDR